MPQKVKGFQNQISSMATQGLEGERRLVFASIVDPKRSSSERNALLLVESIRAFAGSLSGAPVWCLTPEHRGQVSATLRDRLDALDVTLIPFEMDPGVAAFRFTGEASAAALAESMADGRVECLAWLNANSLVLREPREFLLPEGVSLGYRPENYAAKQQLMDNKKKIQKDINYVMGFVGFKSSQKNRELTNTLEAVAVQHLSRVKPPNVLFMDRMDLASVMEELNLNLTDMVDPEFRIESGKLKGICFL